MTLSLWHRGTSASAVLGSLWFLLAILKASDFVHFAAYIRGNLGASPAAASALGWLVVGSEATAGIGLLFMRNHKLRLGAVSFSCLLSFSYVLLTSTVLEGSCGCFGALMAATHSRRLITSGAMTCIGAIAILQEGRRHGSLPAEVKKLTAPEAMCRSETSWEHTT